MASAVVPIVVAAITGAGSAIGAGTVQAVSGLVRERLGRSEQGQAALTGLDESPGDSTAADELRAALRDALDTDQEFERRLTALLRTPPPPPRPPAPPGSVIVGDGNRLRGTNISLGPLTVSTPRGGPGALLALAVLVLGIVVLAVYGGVRVLDADDSPARYSGGSGGDTAARQDAGTGDGAGDTGKPAADGVKRTVLKDKAVVASVLPGLDAVPSGWARKSAPEIHGASECPNVPADLLLCGTVAYRAPDTNNIAHLQLFAFPDVAAARSVYRQLKERNPASIALPALGDESHAYNESEERSAKEVRSLVRSGTVVVGVIYEIEAADWTEVYGADHLEILTRMLTQRLQQAMTGGTPTARAVL
ncbi:hypothetical protein [Streptomyces sp. NPDC020141]|uniref:hypothetical protein n=1 Tax=Streptomyces sp. NPDC020141 TaxID=3365065 RepID=UPI0037B7BF37